MRWIVLAILAGICVPSVSRCFYLLTGLSTLIPEYLQGVAAGSIVLKDVDTRKRYQNLWTEAFFSLQTHLLNVVILVLLGWNVWHWHIPAPPAWLRYVICVICIVAGVGDFLIARHLIRGYMQVRTTRQLFAEVYAHIENPEHPEDLPTPLTIGKVLPVWAGIGTYSLSTVAAGSLICLVWL